MKKIIVASLIAATAMMVSTTVSKVNAFSAPVLDVATFECQPNNNNVVDANISFTRSTVHTDAAISIYSGPTRLVDHAPLPASHTETMHFELERNLPFNFFYLQYNHIKMPFFALGTFFPTDCEDTVKN